MEICLDNSKGPAASISSMCCRVSAYQKRHGCLVSGGGAAWEYIGARVLPPGPVISYRTTQLPTPTETSHISDTMAQVPDTNPIKEDSEAPMMQGESDYFNTTDRPLNESAKDHRPLQTSQLYGREIPYSLRPRGDKVKTGSWKVKQAGSWKEIIRNAGRTSNRSRRIKGRRKAGHRLRDSPRRSKCRHCCR